MKGDEENAVKQCNGEDGVLDLNEAKDPQNTPDDSAEVVSYILNDHAKRFSKTIDGIELLKLAPFIEIALETKYSNLKNISTLDVIKDLDRNNPSEESCKIRDTAKKLKEEFKSSLIETSGNEATKRTGKQKYDAQKKTEDNIPSVTTKPIDKALYPLDKIDNCIWGLLSQNDKNGQIAFATEKHGSKKEATVFYSINFDELENEISISKKLTAFDKRVYVAISTLFNDGTDIVSISQIYRGMGNTHRPSAKDIEKINASLTKMTAARITIDNTTEHEVYSNYPVFEYNGSLLPIEKISAYINGQLTESAIHLFREPPMITFARERKQITTVPIQLLESPVNKTDTNLRIDDYLIERIACMKRNKNLSHKILYNTVFDNCEINTRMQKSRAKQTITRYLAHYKDSNGWIKGYAETTDGVTISL